MTLTDGNKIRGNSFYTCHPRAMRIRIFANLLFCSEKVELKIKKTTRISTGCFLSDNQMQMGI